ncbi:mitochondrial fission factor-like [Erythrolamprus reginae]|uniref:mitochondrial fission factor-like n=1 Tax=Erythrolamprus reginae TaxID=121349 RepID=UPI00396C78EF
MQVPERIVVVGNSEDIPLSRPSDLDLLQSTLFKSLSLKTPPHVISLSDHPLDFLDLQRPPSHNPQNEEIWSVGRLKRERPMSVNATRQNDQLMRNEAAPVLPEARYTLSHIDTSLEGASEDMTVVDAVSLSGQIIKLNCRL